MTKIAYLECPTGIAGDMCLGALIHAGLPLEYLQTQLRQLGIEDEYTLRVETVYRNGQSATKLHVDLTQPADPDALVNQEPGVDVHSTFQAVRLPKPQNSISTASKTVAEHSKSHHSGSHSQPLTIGHSHTHEHSYQDDHSHDHSHDQQHLSSDSANNVANHAPLPKTGSHPSKSAHHSGSRHLSDIEQLIIAAGLPPKAEAWSLAVFRQLAIAESAVHGIPLESVHFHEVGATDAIVDIVGTCLGLDWLGVEQLYCSAMPTGGGTIWAAHGRLPVPAPAVLKLWEMRQVPIYSNGIERELVTPTGAAIATTLAADFGPPPAMTLTCVGLGAGGRELPIPNILRLWIGETVANWSTHRSANSLAVVGQRHAQAVSAVTPISATPLPNPSLPDPQTSGAVSVPQPAQPATEAQVIVLETQIDDANPQAIAYTLEALLAAGALDVFMQPVTMKKSRLGTLITVICSTALAEDCRAILFRETTTLGIRESVQQRTILDREFHSIPTDYGLVTIKLGKNPLTGELLNVQPEYEDCARIARDRQVAWTAVHQAALDAWQIQNPQATH